MRVSDILKVKGNVLFTVTPETPLHDAINTMASHDIGSLVVMEYGDLVGMLTFREIILTLKENGGIDPLGLAVSRSATSRAAKAALVPSTNWLSFVRSTYLSPGTTARRYVPFLFVMLTRTTMDLAA